MNWRVRLTRENVFGSSWSPSASFPFGNYSRCVLLMLQRMTSRVAFEKKGIFELEERARVRSAWKAEQQRSGEFSRISEPFLVFSFVSDVIHIFDFSLPFANFFTHFRLESFVLILSISFFWFLYFFSAAQQQAPAGLLFIPIILMPFVRHFCFISVSLLVWIFFSVWFNSLVLCFIETFCCSSRFVHSSIKCASWWSQLFLNHICLCFFSEKFTVCLWDDARHEPYRAPPLGIPFTASLVSFLELCRQKFSNDAQKLHLNLSTASLCYRFCDVFKIQNDQDLQHYAEIAVTERPKLLLYCNKTPPSSPEDSMKSPKANSSVSSSSRGSVQTSFRAQLMERDNGLCIVTGHSLQDYQLIAAHCYPLHVRSGNPRGLYPFKDLYDIRNGYILDQRVHNIHDAGLCYFDVDPSCEGYLFAFLRLCCFCPLFTSSRCPGLLLCLVLIYVTFRWPFFFSLCSQSRCCQFFDCSLFCFSEYIGVESWETVPRSQRYLICRVHPLVLQSEWHDLFAPLQDKKLPLPQMSDRFPPPCLLKCQKLWYESKRARKCPSCHRFSSKDMTKLLHHLIHCQRPGSTAMVAVPAPISESEEKEISEEVESNQNIDLSDNDDEEENEEDEKEAALVKGLTALSVADSPQVHGNAGSPTMCYCKSRKDCSCSCQTVCQGRCNCKKMQWCVPLPSPPVPPPFS